MKVFKWLLLLLLQIFTLVLVLNIKELSVNLIGGLTFLAVFSIAVFIFQLSRITLADFYFPEKSRKGRSFSVIIPVHNELYCIAHTVKKAMELKTDEYLSQVIVVDDGSTDGTRERLKALEAEYPERLTVIYFDENKGKRAAMRAALSRAEGSIIIQMDSDSYIESGIDELLGYFDDKSVGAVCAHTEPTETNTILQKIQNAYYHVSFRLTKAAESVTNTVLCCSGCCSAYRKSALVDIIDEWNEDSFLGKKVSWGDDRALTNYVLKQGFKTLYSEKTIAKTVVPNSWKQFFKQQLRWKKGWMVNSFLIAKFMLLKKPIIFFTYFLPLFIITVTAPYFIWKVVVWNSLHGHSPMVYIAGILGMAVLSVIFLWQKSDKEGLTYIFLWSFLNIVLSSILVPLAVLTLRDRKWGTR